MTERPRIQYYNPPPMAQRPPLVRNHRYPPPAPSNGMATAGMTLGIIGVVFAILPLLWVISIPLPILAVIFGGVGMGRDAKRGQAKAGLTLGIIGVSLYFLQWVYVASQIAQLGAS